MPVYLVGSGPGDPELLTIKALHILQKADVILYDRLVNIQIMEYARKDCEKIFVGKRYDQKLTQQHDINKMLLEYVQQGKLVVRLKGGDPFIFGRGGEELLYLAQHNITVNIIPGITTAFAAAANLKIPLTHRDFGQSVIFLSGYAKDSHKKEDYLPNYDWDFLSTASLTLVFYMAFSNMKDIVNKLQERGKAEETGVAIISNCSFENEVQVVGQLKNIVELSQTSNLEFPAILIIGDVISEYYSIV